MPRHQRITYSLVSFLIISAQYAHAQAPAPKPTEDESYVTKQVSQCTADMTIAACTGLGLGLAAAVAVVVFGVWYWKRRKTTKTTDAESGQKKRDELLREEGKREAERAHTFAHNENMAKLLSGNLGRANNT